MPPDAQRCPLCGDPHTTLIFEGTLPARPYLNCNHCDLAFVPSQYHLDPKEEKAVYDHHENDHKNKGYRAFLNKLLTPLTKGVAPGAKCLDFGSGPGPAISKILREQSHKCENYDQFYANQPFLLTKKYDLVTSTEVVEHLRKPAEVIKILFDCLTPEGSLGLMTSLQPKDKAFASWHYIKDPTHICFYSDATMAYIAEKYGREFKIIGTDVIIFGPQHPQ
jgi:SAM-dependent methyltransferase